MNHPDAAHRYAHALFALALRKDRLDAVEEDFSALMRVLADQREAGRIMASPVVPFSGKERLADGIAGGRGTLLADFLKVLVLAKRFSELSGIRKEYHRLFEKHKGIREVEAITAVKISEVNRTRLDAALRKKLRAQIHLICRTNPRIVGGLVLRFDGQEIDSSYQTYLAGIRQQLTA
ncbi:MAG: ATP synthase F1 subunit delta [Candidatus Omnitrophota bacterium]|jgi:F-type H+-transporting ATPase subunit delta